MNMKPRNRTIYILATIAVTVIGILSRQIMNPLTALLGKYPGDVLWALMLFFAIGAFLQRLSTVRLAVLSMTLSTAVEISQLYHADWIDAIRGNMIGHLVLGSSFSVYDIVAYGIGILIGASIDHFIVVGRRTSRSN
jgi:hypothetical protein